LADYSGLEPQSVVVGYRRMIYHRRGDPDLGAEFFDSK